MGYRPKVIKIRNPSTAAMVLQFIACALATISMAMLTHAPFTGIPAIAWAAGEAFAGRVLPVAAEAGVISIVSVVCGLQGILWFLDRWGYKFLIRRRVTKELCAGCREELPGNRPMQAGEAYRDALEAALARARAAEAELASLWTEQK